MLSSDDVAIELDLDGRLLKFTSAPRETPGAESHEPDWQALFNAAQLDYGQFSQATPQSTASSIADRRFAWSGAYGPPSHTPVHVEAGAHWGHPVYFEVIFPWTTVSLESSQSVGGDNLNETMASKVFMLVFFVAGATLARYNWKSGRADVRGASLVGFFLFGSFELSMLLSAHDPFRDGFVMTPQFTLALSAGVLAAVLYIALEPWVRRLWPQALITWSRLLAGQLRDPRVARDVLIGVLAAVVTNCARHALYLAFTPEGALAAPAVVEGGVLRFTLDHLMGTRFIGAATFFALFGGFIQALQMFFMMFLCRVCFRRPWLGTLAYLVLLGIAIVVPRFMQGGPIEGILFLVINVFAVAMMIRFGLLALGVWGAVGWFIEHGLLTNKFNAWYGESSLIVVVVVSALTLWAFRTSLGPRPLSTLSSVT
jgi:serine/threonine-protein kinase